LGTLLALLAATSICPFLALSVYADKLRSVVKDGSTTRAVNFRITGWTVSVLCLAGVVFVGAQLLGAVG